MAGGVTLSKPAAGISSRQQTGVDTLSLPAGFSVPAVAVTLTARQLAPDLRVANVAGRAGADRSVVLDKTLGSSAAVTRVLALSVDTGFAIGTVVISGTAWRVGQLHWLAAGVGVRDPAFPAGADHCPEGEAVDHRADGSHVTGGESQAGVGTLLIETGGVVRAVSVSPTLRLRLTDLWLRGSAGDEGVTNPSWWTGALGVVVVDSAAG